jgi:hypothetical protein
MRKPARKVRSWPTAWWRPIVRINLRLHSMPTTTNTTKSTRRCRRRRWRRKRRRRNIHSSSLLCTPRDCRICVFQSLIKLRQRATSPVTIQGCPSSSGISERVSPHPCKASIAHAPGWPRNQASDRNEDSSLAIHQAFVFLLTCYDWDSD